MRSALHNNLPIHGRSYPEVIFVDFASETSGARVCAAPASRRDDRLSAPEDVFEAAIQSVQLLNREALTITQRNVNRSFSLLKRLAAIRNLGSVIDLEVAYWPDRFFALAGQIEQLSALSAKVLLDTLGAMTRATCEVPYLNSSNHGSRAWTTPGISHLLTQRQSPERRRTARG
jgi:hypothetical protein